MLGLIKEGWFEGMGERIKNKSVIFESAYSLLIGG